MIENRDCRMSLKYDNPPPPTIWLLIMSFLRTAVLLVVVAAIVVPSFVRYGMRECKDFKIESQAGKIFIVTGGNSGLGLATAKDLAKAGGTVIIAVRSVKKGEAAKEEILRIAPSAKIDVMEMDLSSFESVKAFANAFKEKYTGLDVLVNNAGIMAMPKRQVTVDGLEAQIGTNHFGHFLLTAILFPIIKQNGRIINHSSSAYAFADKNFVNDDLLSEKHYSPWTAYGNSKAANLMFTYELNKRLEASGNPRNITSVAVHPGYTSTNLQAGPGYPFWEEVNNLLAMAPEDGSQSQTLAATSPDVKPSYQDFIGPKYSLFGPPRVKTTYFSKDETKQRRLWEESERITGVKFEGL